MAEWLKGCEICNAGLCKEMDQLIDKHRLTERTAAGQLALTVKERLGFPLYSGPQLRDRYRYHRGKKKPKAYSSKDHSQEELEALANGEVGEIPPAKKAPKKSGQKTKPADGGEKSEGILHEVSDAMRYAAMAIANLECIPPDDSKRLDAFQMVEDWIVAAKEGTEG